MKIITPNLTLIPENGPFEFGQIANFFYFIAKLLTFTCSLTVGSTHPMLSGSDFSFPYDLRRLKCTLLTRKRTSGFSKRNCTIVLNAAMGNQKMNNQKVE